MPQVLPEPTMVELSDGPVATYAWDGEAPAGDVVFCHGTPWSARVWADVASRLGERFRVFAWDMPGYGQSPKAGEVALGLDRQGERFAELLPHWGVERPHVVCHDIGGAVGLRAHLLGGCDFASLFLCDIVALEPWGSPFFRLVAEHEAVFAALPGALHQALVEAYITGATKLPLADGELESLVQPWLGEDGQRAFYRQIAALRPEHTRPVVERLPGVRCPVQIAWGAADPWLDVAQAYRLRDLLPGSPTVVELPGAGHLVPLEAPEAFDAVLGDWLERQADPGSSISRFT